MRRSSRLVCAVGLALSMFAPAAMAAPPIFDHVPANAVAVVTAPSIARFHKNADAFAKAVNSPLPIPELEEMMEQMGIPPSKAFDPQKAAAAIAFIAPKQDAGDKKDEDAESGPEKMVVFILPVSSYAGFVGDFEGKPGPAGGIDTGSLNGSEIYFKDIGGGYVAMAQDKETLGRAEWNDAGAAAHRSALGKAGDSLVESTDFSLTIFTQEAKKYLPEVEKAVEDQMANNPGGEALGKLKDSQIGQFLTGPFMDDSTASVTGFRFDAQGLTIDAALGFKDGSDTAKKLSGITGSSDELLSKLPAQPYLFAMATDLSAPGTRKIVDELLAKEGEDAPAGIPGFLTNWFKNSDGGAMIIGMPPGGLMSGLFTSTIAYVKTSNPDAFLKNMQDGLAQLNGKSVQGLALESSYTPGGGDIEGAKVDTWGIKMKVDENSDEDPGQVAMALPAIFGAAGGPSGFVTKANGGLIQTFGRNQGLMSSAMKVGNGGESFTADKVLAKVAEQLPKNRVAEVYVGMKSFLESAIPLMAAMNINVDVEIPPSLPPIGVGVAGGDQGLHVGLYLPAATLKTMVAVYMQVQAAQMAGDAPEPNGGKKNDAKKGAGQPRF